jgi:hypothetical protein
VSPLVKFTLGRLGLFAVVFVLLLPLPLNVLVKAMIALLVSFVLSYFLLAEWRNQMGEQLAGAATRRAEEKERLRAALAGDEEAAAAGDRVELSDKSPAGDDEPAPKAAEDERSTAGDEPKSTAGDGELTPTAGDGELATEPRTKS